MSPRLIVIGILLLVAAFVLRQAGWGGIAVAAFIGGILLIGRGFLDIISSTVDQEIPLVARSLADVCLPLPTQFSIYTWRGTDLKEPPSPDLLYEIPISSQPKTVPSLAVTDTETGKHILLLAMTRLSENQFHVQAKHWTDKGDIRYTGEATLDELAIIIERIKEDPARRGRFLK